MSAQEVFLFDTKHSVTHSDCNTSAKSTSSSASTSRLQGKANRWTPQEDKLLYSLVEKHGNKNWTKIAGSIQKKTPVQCLHRWTNVLAPGLRKGPWTGEEDAKLEEWISVEGPTKWTQCAEYITGRNGKQCRERWLNTLCPAVKKGNWTAEEDYLIFSLYDKIGGKWSKMLNFFSGRTENAIKNRFYCSLRKEASQDEAYVNCKATLYKASTQELLSFYDRCFTEKQKNFLSFAEKANKGGKAYVDNVEEMLITSVFKEEDSENDAEMEEMQIQNNLKGSAVSKVNILNVDQKIEELKNCDFLVDDSDLQDVENKLESFFNELSDPPKPFSVNIAQNSTKLGENKVNTQNLLRQLEMMETWIKNTKKKLINPSTTTVEFEREFDNNLDFFDLFKDNGHFNDNDDFYNTF